MRNPLEAGGVPPQEARVVRSPVVDSIRQELLSQGAFIVREIVITREVGNLRTRSKVLQLIDLYTAPQIYNFKYGSDKNIYADGTIMVLRGLIRGLEETVKRAHGGAIDHSKNTVWPVVNGSRIGNGILFFDELLGQEQVDSKVTTTEVRSGSLKEIGFKPGLSNRKIDTALVRRIVINVYPHPLLALIIPRLSGSVFRAAPSLKELDPEIDFYSLVDIQRHGASSKAAVAALEHGLVTQQELEDIFSKAA
ncbi:MAG: hypothetical protein HY427_03215 [Candidatus Levybacteria bacterium]|nr:hypothetical protein [Candidatus Levybacteria bacterium]